MTAKPYKVSIRLAQPSDSKAIAKVHVQSWQETYEGIIPADYLANLSVEQRESMWTEILSSPNPDHVFVAMVDDEVVGFISGGSAREEHGFDAELYAIYLLKKFHKRGIGKELFNHLKASLRQNGFSGMYLWVLRDNATTEFYRAMGGKIGAQKEETIGGKALIEDLYYWID